MNQASFKFLEIRRKFNLSSQFQVFLHVTLCPTPKSKYTFYFLTKNYRLYKGLEGRTSHTSIGKSATESERPFKQSIGDTIFCQ